MSRGDAWCEIVGDDDPKVGSYGVMSISELRETTLADSLETVRAGVEEMLDEQGIRDPARRARLLAAFESKYRAKILPLIEVSIDKVQLRIRGKEPTH